ncbi:MAG TPA: M12 family metallo-peptidase [Pyrinomonadaceae bacterium]
MLFTALFAALFLALSSAGLAPEAARVNVCAQTDPCPQMNVGGNTSLTWPPGSYVEVMFDNSVTPERQAIYKQVLDNWSRSNGQGVTFRTSGAFGSQNPDHTMLIYDAVPSAGASYRGYVEYQQWDSGGALQFVQIAINPGVTDPTALANAMSHEVSHNFGLNHTTDGSLSSQTASSLYNTANGLNDTSTGAPGPTPCDQQVINSVYTNGGVKYVEPTLNGGDGGGGGGVYDPYYYDYYDYCTPYYWVYYESWDGGKSWDIVDVSYAGCW